MEVFKIIYTLLGGLGIFFYGMKAMSEALQSVAGDMIKNIINTLTKNRFYAVLVGTLVTILVQSSSVTTVMVVGFVNASLMNLTQAIGIIFGANIGTTITGWIISIKVGKYGLLFIGVGIFPLLFGKTNTWRQVGRVLFGIGMIFLGLKFMSGAFKPLRNMPEFLDAISYFNGQHYGSYLASIMVGCLLTIVIQSSSAMLGITIALASTGVIQFHTAAALVLGENIGTTITAMLAAVGANVNAKRTAKAHAIFNLLGVFIVFCIFPYFVEFVDYLVPGSPAFVDENGDFPNVAVHIASGHSLFNISITLLFLPFVNQLAKLVTAITPDTEYKEQHHLVMLGEPRDTVAATSLAQARAELNRLKDVVDRMYYLSKKFLTDEVSSQPKALAKMRSYEEATDNMQQEISVFLIKVMENPLTPSESREAQSLMRLADEFESVADYLERLVTYSTRASHKDLFKDEAGPDFFNFFDKVENYYNSCASQMAKNEKTDLAFVNLKSEELRIEANSLRERHLERISHAGYSPSTALTYSDMIVALRKVRSHTQNISEAHNRIFYKG